jgi:hypothetical protein
LVASIWHVTPDAWTAIATWAAVCIAFIAVVVAAVIGGRQLSQARRIRDEESQPYVVVYTAESGNDPRHLDLVIKNFGKTAATDVRVTFSEPLHSAILADTKGFDPIAVPDVIPLLVPGQEWRTFWDFTVQRAAAEHLPRQYTAKVRFKDSQGKTEYPEASFVIDWDVLIKRGFVSVYNMHDAARALREINEKLGKATVPGGAIKVVSYDGDAINERERQLWAEHQRDADSDSGNRDP